MQPQYIAYWMYYCSGRAWVVRCAQQAKHNIVHTCIETHTVQIIQIIQS